MLPLTSDEGSIDAALAKTPKLDFGTHIYDGLQSAADLLSVAGIENGSIVLLSDGTDVGSTVDQQAATTLSTERRHRVFAVGLRSAQYDPEALSSVVEQTAGTYSEASSSAALSQIYSQLGYTLSNEYVLATGRSRARARPIVAVKVNGRPGHRAAATRRLRLRPSVAPTEPSRSGIASSSRR